MKESTLEKTLVREVKKAGGLCIKLPAFLYRGIPDRLILLPGARVYFIELKADKGIISVHQDRFIIILRSLGFSCYIIQGQTRLKEFLDGHVKNTQHL